MKKTCERTILCNLENDIPSSKPSSRLLFEQAQHRRQRKRRRRSVLRSRRRGQLRVTEACFAWRGRQCLPRDVQVVVPAMFERSQWSCAVSAEAYLAPDSKPPYWILRRLLPEQGHLKQASEASRNGQAVEYEWNRRCNRAVCGVKSCERKLTY